MELTEPDDDDAAAPLPRCDVTDLVGQPPPSTMSIALPPPADAMVAPSMCGLVNNSPPLSIPDHALLVPVPLDLNVQDLTEWMNGAFSGVGVDMSRLRFVLQVCVCVFVCVCSHIGVRLLCGRNCH